MSNNSIVNSRAALAVCFAILTAVSGLASCSGGGAGIEEGNPVSGNGSGGNAVFPAVLPPKIAAAAACTAYPALSGTTYYYCDCGTGAQAGCVAGNDSNDGLSTSTPKRTIGDAATRVRTQLAANDTVALCKGGAFNATGSLRLGSTRCSAGTACNDLRDYTPTTFSGSAKPIINNAAGAVDLFSVAGNVGGVRLLNIRLRGVPGTVGDRNNAIFIYNGAHDVTMCNLDMDAFDLAVYNAGGNAGVSSTNNIKLTGSTIINSRRMGFLGGGNNADVSYNYWDGNGGSTKFDHTIYVAVHQAVSNVSVVGNYIHGQYGPTCLGAVIVGHTSIDGFLAAYNVIDIDASASSGGCFGIGFGAGGSPDPVYMRNAKFVGNIIKNGGNTSLSVANCPDCVIENNLIIQDWAYGPTGNYSVIGISVPSEPAVVPKDDVNDRNLIRNNTIWFGPRSTGGGTGIIVGEEGTGHVIVNNSVYYSSTSAGQGVNCFNYSLPQASYSSIDNNHCGSATTSYSWVAGHGDLAAWQTSGFDTNSVTGNPLFANPGTDFTPGVLLPNAGTTANSSAYSGLDLAGNVRPSVPTIGAVEP